MVPKKIFLVGMPGSGKSTLGKSLARKLGLSFIDLDTEIERREGKSIKEIFSQQEEDYFRQVESSALKELASSATSFVLATGGGAPCFHDGMKTINTSGVSIFLEVSVDELVERVKNNKDRPLLQADDEVDLRSRLESIQSKRLPIYREAHIISQDSNVDSLAAKIQSIE